jgi:RNA-directed DNA polymerase
MGHWEFGFVADFLLTSFRKSSRAGLSIVGLIQWFLNLFRRKPARRDVSRLGGDDQSLDHVEETVVSDGAPLNPAHRRRAVRDPRLLPKPRRKLSVWGGPKPARVMSADEARRLFSATLRTKNREIRDLLVDEEQLQRYGLPLWRSEDELAEALGISVKQLRHFSIHREADPVCHYVTFAIPKRNGSPRLIMAPKRRLKALQRELLRQLVEQLPVSEHAHGFRRKRSIRTGAEPHVGRPVVLRMDLKDFFPSVTFGRVRGLLVALGYSYPVATVLAVLMTEAPRQPVEIDGQILFTPVGPRHCVQGAPTSPGLCNAIALRLDRRLAGLARSFKWSYTRYADDLAFSGDDPAQCQALRAIAMRICREEGFQVNHDKTRIARQGQRQAVTGVTVNQTLGLSRKERRRLRAMIHRTRTEIQNGTADPAQLNSLRGKLAYLAMLNPEQAAKLRKRLDDEGDQAGISD